jgi:hypothetical protein
MWPTSECSHAGFELSLRAGREPEPVKDEYGTPTGASPGGLESGDTGRVVECGEVASSRVVIRQL